MTNYETFQLAEDIKNLDMCYVGKDNKLHKIKSAYELNHDLVIVNNMVTSEEYISNNNQDNIILSKDSLVSGFKVTIIPKQKLL